MAVDKLVDSAQLDANLTAVANAIRSKAGVSGALSFPNGMVSAINGITSGGGSPNLQSKSVTYTSNGSATVTPDAGYDGLSQVNVTVDVSGGGGGTYSVTVNANESTTFVYYGTDGYEWLSAGESATISVPQNTIIVIVITMTLFGTWTTTGNVTEINLSSTQSRAYRINGNATINVGMEGF